MGGFSGGRGRAGRLAPREGGVKRRGGRGPRRLSLILVSILPHVSCSLPPTLHSTLPCLLTMSSWR